MIAVISDSHFYNGWAGGKYNAQDVNSRLLDIERVHLDFVDQCIERGVKHIFHGGDLYHKRNPTQVVIHHSLSWIEKAVQNDIHVVLLPGNHDFNFVQHAMAFLDRPSLISQHVHFIQDLKIREFQDIPVLAIPFGRPDDFTAKDVGELTDSLPSEGIVFGHAQPQDCLPGIEDTFNERDPIVLASEDLINTRAEVLLGHIHNRQTYVLGSCVCLAFDDSHDKFAWIGEGGNRGEFVRLDQPVYHTVRIDVRDKSHLDEIEKFVDTTTKPGMVRLLIENADEGFVLDPHAVSEILGDQFSLTQKLIKRREQRVALQVHEDVSLRKSLIGYQKANGYDGDRRAGLELEILSEATGDQA